MDDPALIIMVAMGLSGGAYSMARDILRIFRYYKMSQHIEFEILCAEDRFFSAIDMAIVSPPPNLTHPLAGCHWKKRKSTPESYAASVSLVENYGRGGATLEIRAKWILLPEQQSAQRTIRLEFEVNESRPGRRAEQIAYQLGSMTETIVTRLNNQHTGTAVGAQHSYVETMLGNLGSRYWVRAADSNAEEKTHDRQFDQQQQVSQTRWPSAQDYNEGMQNPRSAFIDFDLSYGRPVVDQLGLPKAISGNFASVYRIRCHQIDFAVRCFLRSVKDREYRYKKLSQYICSDTLSYTVDMQYLTEGIRIGDTLYPVLKMEWVEGVTLECYVQQKLSNSESLLPLLSKFRAMTQALYDEEIAHGDLQHGNIIVRNEELILVDYDGMFVPALSELSVSHEVGHPNYQHPRRSRHHFGSYLDNFSSFVIDTSILALSINPEVWNSLKGGDDCMLFRRNDFLRPHESKVFQTLIGLGDKELTARCTQLTSFLSRELQEIPALGVDGQPLPLRTDPARSDKPLDSSSANLPAWLSGYSDSALD